MENHKKQKTFLMVRMLSLEKLTSRLLGSQLMPESGWFSW